MGEPHDEVSGWKWEFLVKTRARWVTMDENRYSELPRIRRFITDQMEGKCTRCVVFFFTTEFPFSLQNHNP